MNILSLAERVLSQPTAPFRELWVLAQISQILEENRIPFCWDRYGNLIGGVNSTKDLQKKRLVFLAHTDHPGFHVIKQTNAKTVEARWLGGAPFDKMKGSRVRVFHVGEPSRSAVGIIKSVEKKAYSRSGRKISIQFSKPHACDSLSFGAFAFDGFKTKGGRVISRAVDDLGGCIVSLMVLLQSKNKNTACIFTRGEEVGYVGCWGILKSNILSKKSWLISLEASKALPGAEIGKGPVLRLGDRSTLFNSDVAIWMWNRAKDLAKKNKNFNFQRRLMDGGSCEATAIHLHGYKVAGLSLPLGNYHNDGVRGPSAEEIAIQDLKNAALYCTYLSENLPKEWEPSKKALSELNKNFKHFLPYLREIT